jgi:hypothetical protein
VVSSTNRGATWEDISFFIGLVLPCFTTPQISFYSGYFPQLAAVVQPLLLGALQSLTTVLLKTAANYLQRFLYNNRCQIPFTAVFN